MSSHFCLQTSHNLAYPHHVNKSIKWHEELDGWGTGAKEELALIQYCVLMVEIKKLIGYVNSGYSQQGISKLRRKIAISNMDCD